MAVTLLALALVSIPASASAAEAFSTTTPTQLVAFSNANPYPSTVEVSGVRGVLTGVTARLDGVTVSGTDIDVMLVSPHGESVILTSDIPVESDTQTWTYSDAAAAPQADGSTGTYKPTNADTATDEFPAPAPAPPYGDTLSDLNGPSPNGTWKLFVKGGVNGSIAGWSITLTTAVGNLEVQPGDKDFASVDVGAQSTPETFTFTNTGQAPLTVTNVRYDGTQPADFVSAADGCSGATVAVGASCAVQVAFKPTAVGPRRAFLIVSHDASGAPVTAQLAGRGQTPPAPTPVESGSPDIDIRSFRFLTPPVVNQPTTLQVVASDKKATVTGLIVDFGETLGLWAASACVVGSNEGGTSTFRVPYTFLSAGEHTLKVTVFSGGCGTPKVHTYEVKVVVGNGQTAARRAHVSQDAAAPTITSTCKDANLVPSGKLAKRIAKALLCVMNEQRKLAKLKPLKASKKLNKSALAHSRAMVVGKFFAHQGPKEPPLIKRLKKAKYKGAAAENIGAGAGPLASPLMMVNGWMNSPIHRANLLYRKWKTVGIGFVAVFPVSATQPAGTFTTNFGTK